MGKPCRCSDSDEGQYDYLSKLNDTQIQLLNRGIIHIFGRIDSDTFDYVEACLMLAHGSGEEPPDLTVRINSPGGVVGPSMQIYDLLCNYPGTIYGIVIGIGMSGGNIILQGCDVRMATQGSQLLVHDVRSHLSFNVMDERKKIIKDVNEDIDDGMFWQEKIFAIYQERSGLSRSHLKRIFEKAKALSVEESLHYKFIDFIYRFDKVAQKQRVESVENLVEAIDEIKEQYAKPSVVPPSRRHMTIASKLQEPAVKPKRAKAAAPKAPAKAKPAAGKK